jgi:hypothetical protein
MQIIQNDHWPRQKIQDFRAIDTPARLSSAAAYTAALTPTLRAYLVTQIWRLPRAPDFQYYNELFPRSCIAPMRVRVAALGNSGVSSSSRSQLAEAQLAPHCKVRFPTKGSFYHHISAGQNRYLRVN